MRFNGPELGGWYASDQIRTAAAEVGHHLRREASARSVASMSRTYRNYTATLLGDYLDIRGQQALYPDVYASDRYDASQQFGENVRTELSPNFGDGRGQAAAAWSCDLTTSIPSANLTPRMIFGNWL